MDQCSKMHEAGKLTTSQPTCSGQIVRCTAEGNSDRYYCGAPGCAPEGTYHANQRVGGRATTK